MKLRFTRETRGHITTIRITAPEYARLQALAADEKLTVIEKLRRDLELDPSDQLVIRVSATRA